MQLVSIDGLVLHSDLPSAMDFESSDELLNRVQTMFRTTFLSNIMGVQSDCPHRERFGYGRRALACVFLFGVHLTRCHRP